MLCDSISITTLTVVSSAKPVRESAKPNENRPGVRKSLQIRAAEAIGLAVIVLLILVYALARYGRSIPWNAR